MSTQPLATLNAYRAHGRPEARLEDGVAEPQTVLRRLPQVGIDLAKVTQQLEAEGVQKFINPFDQVMDRLQQARASALETLPTDP